MHDQQIKKSATKGSAINQDATGVTRQVDGALDSTNFTLDRLEALAVDLIRRLEPVTGGYPEPERESDSPAVALVPIAARISYINSRIMQVGDRLAHALSALEI